MERISLDTLPPKKEVAITWDDNESVPGVFLRCGASTYEACIANGILYDGMLYVPELERRKGIGSSLLLQLVEIAKEHGIKKIRHTIQTVEGLMLIHHVLKQSERKYFFCGKDEISFEEATAILNRKKAEGKQDNTSIMINSITKVDQLEKFKNTSPNSG